MIKVSEEVKGQFSAAVFSASMKFDKFKAYDAARKLFPEIKNYRDLEERGYELLFSEVREKLQITEEAEAAYTVRIEEINHRRSLAIEQLRVQIGTLAQQLSSARTLVRDADQKLMVAKLAKATGKGNDLKAQLDQALRVAKEAEENLETINAACITAESEYRKTNEAQMKHYEQDMQEVVYQYPLLAIFFKWRSDKLSSIKGYSEPYPKNVVGDLDFKYKG